MKTARAVVEGMFNAVLREDIPAVVACLDADVVCVEPESLAYGGTHRGRDAFLQNVLGAIVGKCEMSIANPSFIGDGDTVAAAMHITFKSRKTGKAVVMPYVELYTVKDGTVREIRVYPQDTQKMVEFWNTN